MQQVSESRCFWGLQQRYQHRSSVLDCDMHFSIYLPPQAEEREVPVLYWLSGLTCTDENFVIKAGAQRYAAEHGIAIVAPDTSPRGDHVPDDPEEAYDFGKGAGFYVNATRAPWSTNYRMYDYVVEELPGLVQEHFELDHQKVSIFGHSMGGHGALSIALRNPGRYSSVSAFSPIVAPSVVPWGEKALSGYLGDDRDSWKEYDSCELIRAGARHLPMLVDQGTDDAFLEEQLRTTLLEQTCEAAEFPVTVRHQAGYDHSYFFIASFIGSHIAFHSQALGNYNRM
jgi:S-formylglutathione hydrolase